MQQHSPTSVGSRKSTLGNIVGSSGESSSSCLILWFSLRRVLYSSKLSEEIGHALLAWGALLFICTPAIFAQFNSSIQGVVTDPSGAGIPKASVTVSNLATNVAQSTIADAQGHYSFVALAPGPYRVSARAHGFATLTVDISLTTSQTLAVPLRLSVAAASQEVNVTGEAPVLDIAETRNQLTLQTQALQSIPLQGRNMITLVTMAPGVTGLGTISSGSPGSATDNYGTELQVDASANGRNLQRNLYVIDGLDVTSDFRPGVLNLTPNPDAIAEVSIQTNTFAVDYGRASSIEMVMTTKSVTNKFHGSVSDYFTTEQLWAGTEFVHSYAPFHSNNISATLGGPIIRRQQLFFFGSVEPLRALMSNSSVASFEDPQFTAWAQLNFPSTIGTKLLTNYKPFAVSPTGISQTAAQVFPGSCGTAATAFIPCNLPMIDRGIFNATNYRNGMQYNIRIDKYFKSDRIYGNLFRTTLATNAPAARPQFDTTNNYFSTSVQLNETHTFSPTALNEAAFGYLHPQGTNTETGIFTVPVISVQGISAGFGDGFAQGVFSQPNYHWRDVLSHIHGPHSLRFGYDGWPGQALGRTAALYSQPSFTFTNLLSLVEDQPYSESGLAYDPLTGKPATANSPNAAMTTAGAFGEDTWKISKSITLTDGLRWDDYGNPYAINNTFLSNFYFGAGLTENEQITNGFFQAQRQLFNHALANVFSPRVGAAWDVRGNGKWVLHGGFGIYHDWPNIGTTTSGLSSNPPGFVIPTFYAGTSSPPIFALGTSNTYPFGFPYPPLAATSLDSRGGLTGEHLNVGGIDPNLKASSSYVYTATLEHSFGNHIVASIGYSRERSDGLLGGSGISNATNLTFYGWDINRFSGDLIQCNCTVPTRLNPSFGTINYSTNTSKSQYNGIIGALRARFGARGFLDASYTHSRSYDDAATYPTVANIAQYWGPSLWDIPDRVSLACSYQLPGFNNGHGSLGHFTNGWILSGITILQSGTPFTVLTTAPFLPLRNSSGQIIGYAPGSGDFNADGDNYDYPDVLSYKTTNTRQAYLSGVFSKANFPNPALGVEGDEKVNRFRNPGFAETDAALAKDTALTERVRLQLRFEFYNVFNRVNLGPVDSNLSDSNFGRVTSQLKPRWIQLGPRLSFWPQRSYCIEIFR